MADRPQLKADQIIEAVPAVGGRGEAEPVACRDGSNCSLEGSRGNVVALVHDHEPVTGELAGQFGPPGEGLQRDDVDGARELRASAAQLPGLDPQEFLDLIAPLLGQGLAVHQNQRVEASTGDGRGGHDGLA